MTDLTVPSVENALGYQNERQRLRQALNELVHQIDLDEQLRLRSIQQAILEASAWWWAWRAEQFHWAGDLETAQACLNKAAFITWEAAGELVSP